MPDGIFIRWFTCWISSMIGLFVLFASLPTYFFTATVAIFLINHSIPAQFTLAFIIGVNVLGAFFAWVFAAPISDYLARKIFKLDMTPWNK